MRSSQHTMRRPSHSLGPRKRSTSGGSKIAVSLNSDSGHSDFIVDAFAMCAGLVVASLIGRILGRFDFKLDV